MVFYLPTYSTAYCYITTIFGQPNLQFRQPKCKALLSEGQHKNSIKKICYELDILCCRIAIEMFKDVSYNRLLQGQSTTLYSTYTCNTQQTMKDLTINNNNNDENDGDDDIYL